MPTLDLDGVDIYYETIGTGEPLLFIHGLGSSVRDWEEQVQYYSKRYQVIAFDVRGHGRSQKPDGPYSMQCFALDAVNLIYALALSPVHVIGISMGGMIAFQLAVSFPAVVKSLVVVNSTPEFIVDTLKKRLQVWQRYFIVRLLGMERLGKILGKRLFPGVEHEALRERFARRWAENDDVSYRAAMRAIVGWTVADQIGSIDCPALMIASEQDYSPLEEKKAYVERMRYAKLVIIEGAHHAVPLEYPQRFNAVLDVFLAEQTEPGKD